jgi:preprotein translocase subunit YajC
MLVSPAYAQSAGAVGGGGDLLIQFLPLILIFVVFYFLLIRPQQQQRKKHREMLEAIRRGDRVMTAGGIIGVVKSVGNDEDLSVEIAENVRVKVARSTIANVLSKTEPVNGKGKGKSKGKADKADQSDKDDDDDDDADSGDNNASAKDAG